MIKNILIATSYLGILKTLHTCLSENEYNVIGVFSRERSDIINYANEVGIQYVDIEKVDSKLEELFASKIDLGIAWGINYLNNDLLELPDKGFINIHPSNLPSYRGGFPFQAQILNDEKFFKISIHKTTPIIDKGIVLAKSDSIIIEENDGMVSLVNKCLNAVPGLIIKVLNNFDECYSNPEIINWEDAKSLPNAWGKIKRFKGYENGVLGNLAIDFNTDTIAVLKRKIKAFDMIGGPYFQVYNTVLNVKSIKEVINEKTNSLGEVVNFSKNEITIQCIGAQLTFKININDTFSKVPIEIDKNMVALNSIRLDDYVNKTIFSK